MTCRYLFAMGNISKSLLVILSELFCVVICNHQPPLQGTMEAHYLRTFNNYLSTRLTPSDWNSVQNEYTRFCWYGNRYPRLIGKIQYNVLAYRDISDGDKQFQLMDPNGNFTSDAKVVKKFMEGLKAEGGGDFPEDVAGALMKVKFLTQSLDLLSTNHISVCRYSRMILRYASKNCRHK